MRVSLATSLHLNHGASGLDLAAGDRPAMQAFVPMGLLSIKALSDRELRGVDTRVTELNTLIDRGAIPNDDRFYDRLAAAIVQPGDAVVGLMTDADSLHHTIAVAEAIRAREPGARLCLGGPAASPIGGLLLETFPFLDYVVSGEGEWTHVELVRRSSAARAWTWCAA